jgi:hypothetical protein
VSMLMMLVGFSLRGDFGCRARHSPSVPCTGPVGAIVVVDGVGPA